MRGQLKQRAVQIARRSGFLPTVERLNNLRLANAHAADDALFCREHPQFRTPPKALMHETFGPISYRGYWSGGLKTAELLVDLIAKECPHASSVLEWGCGPGRVLNHLVALLPKARFSGADCNVAAIEWCKQVIDASFVLNGPFPPLPFHDGQFDFVYGISVLTHLSVPQQKSWVAEIHRLLRPGGMAMLTTNSKTSALLAHERRAFEEEGVVVRGNVAEGVRCFVCCHHPDYVRRALFGEFSICQHIPAGTEPKFEQDIWLLQ